MAQVAAETPFPAHRITRTVSYRTVLLAVVAAAAVAGFALADGASAAATQAADGEMIRLLRMMAVLKIAFVAGAAWLVDWRLRQPVGAPAAAAYLAGLGLMAVGPGLIWNLQHLILGAVLLHTGVVLLIMLAWKDEGLRFPLRRT